MLFVFMALDLVVGRDCGLRLPLLQKFENGQGTLLYLFTVYEVTLLYLFTYNMYMKYDSFERKGGKSGGSGTQTHLFCPTSNPQAWVRTF